MVIYWKKSRIYNIFFLSIQMQKEINNYICIYSEILMTGAYFNHFPPFNLKIRIQGKRCLI